jgi:peroxiredoxin
MALKAGDRIPESVVTTMGDGGPTPVSTTDYFSGRMVVLFSVPGAFTPTCSARHLPGFVEQAAAIKGKGIDAIACTAVNDVFVMDAWKKAAGSDDIDMLADGNGAFVSAMGLELDATGFGMGHRGQRFALVAEDGVVTHLFVEEGGDFKVSSAEHVLAAL